jgi:hypothetical protein
MAETTEVKPATDFAKIPRKWPIVMAVAMFGAAIWGGGEVARGEIAQQELDSITAKGRLVKVKVALPPGVVVTNGMLEEIEVFANRVEPYCVNRAASAVGKKTKYGLEAGQVLTVKDLE